MSEAGHRRLMSALVGSGDRIAALAVYERCCQILSVELGVEPEAESAALAEAIREGTMGGGVQLEQPAMGAQAGQWQGRLVTAAEHEMEGWGQLLYQERHGAVHRRLGDDVIVVEDEQAGFGELGQVVQQGASSVLSGGKGG